MKPEHERALRELRAELDKQSTSPEWGDVRYAQLEALDAALAEIEREHSCVRCGASLIPESLPAPRCEDCPESCPECDARGICDPLCPRDLGERAGREPGR